MAEHTPTPWAHEGNEIVTAYTGPGGRVIAIAAHGTVSAAPPLRLGDDDWDLGMANLSYMARAANGYERYKAALEAITGIAGNLTDEAVEAVGGVNDARSRALMVVTARQIAKNALAQKESE